jgi:hypothetical protein
MSYLKIYHYSENLCISSKDKVKRKYIQSNIQSSIKEMFRQGHRLVTFIESVEILKE